MKQMPEAMIDGSAQQEGHDVAALLRAWTHLPTRLLPTADSMCCSGLDCCSVESACMKTLGTVRIQTGSLPRFARANT